MFMQFETKQGERVCVQIKEILMISEDKKGVTVELSDGTPILVSQSYDVVLRQLEKRNVFTRHDGF